LAEALVRREEFFAAAKLGWHSRPEAIRRLIENALSAKTKRRSSRGEK